MNGGWRDLLEAAVSAAPPAERPLLIGELARWQAQLFMVPVLSRPGTSTPATKKPSECLLSVQEVAKRLGVSNAFVYRHGTEVGAVHVGRSLRFTEASIIRYLAAHR